MLLNLLYQMLTTGQNTTFAMAETPTPYRVAPSDLSVQRTFEALQRALQNTDPGNLSREWIKQDVDFKHLQQQYPHEWQQFICHLC